MHAKAIVARVVGPCLTKMHAKRAAALLRATTALLHGGITRLSAIALCLDGGTALKHRLKSVDRLLGNPALHRARGARCTGMSRSTGCETCRCSWW